MKKKVFGRKLSRSRPSREALFASLIRAMLLNGKIVTTRAKAKAIQGDLERYVTIAKKGDISGRRRVLANLDNANDALEALYQNVAPAFAGRQSGYSRTISLPPRKGDAAAMMRIEWTETLTVAAKPLNKTKKTDKEVKSKEKPNIETKTKKGEPKK